MGSGAHTFTFLGGVPGGRPDMEIAATWHPKRALGLSRVCHTHTARCDRTIWGQNLTGAMGVTEGLAGPCQSSRRPHPGPVGARRHNGVGVARPPTAPAGGVAGRPQGSPELRPSYVGTAVPPPQVHNTQPLCSVHMATARALTGAWDVLHRRAPRGPSWRLSEPSQLHNRNLKGTGSSGNCCRTATYGTPREFSTSSTSSVVVFRTGQNHLL